eukprot:4386266-Prymnesium_polylepis.1
MWEGTPFPEGTWLALWPNPNRVGGTDPIWARLSLGPPHGQGDPALRRSGYIWIELGPAAWARYPVFTRCPQGRLFHLFTGPTWLGAFPTSMRKHPPEACTADQRAHSVHEAAANKT